MSNDKQSNQLKLSQVSVVKTQAVKTNYLSNSKQSIQLKLSEISAVPSISSQNSSSLATITVRFVQRASPSNAASRCRLALNHELL